MDWNAYLRSNLEQTGSARLTRYRGAMGAFLGEERERSDSRQMPNLSFLDFSSNDYLGLASNPQVIAALRGEDNLGAGASPVLTGYTASHRELENQLANLNETEAALVFSSGYACNLGVLSCLAGKGDLIASDSLNHASLIDGCRLSRARTFVYPHSDIETLERYLEAHRSQYGRVLLVSESIFSMDGDSARLRELVELAKGYECGLIVDEAHATGVYGNHGSGLSEEWELGHFLLAKLGTLSKAVGAIGGYVCGTSDLIEFLVNHCRSYLFSTAPPMPIMRAITQSLKLLDSMHAERRELRRASLGVRKRLRAVGWSVPEGDSPIVPVMLGAAEDALELSQALRNEQILVPAIRPPTVPDGSSRLRISLSIKHSPEDIDRLCTTMARLSP